MRVGYILAAVAIAACGRVDDPGTSGAGPADPPPQTPAQPPVTVALVTDATGAGSIGIVADQSSIAHTVHSHPSIVIFPLGTTVTLTAQAIEGTQLQSWSGACSGTAPTCVLTLTEPSTTVGALFVPVPELPDPSPGTPYALRHVVVPDGWIHVTDVNDAGDVLGTVYYDASAIHFTPFIWHYATGEVTYLELGDPPTQAEAVALNDRGAAVLRESGTGHYWLYEDGQVRPILPDRNIDVSDLGDQGWIVGGIGPEAMLYDPSGGTLTMLGEREVVGVNGSGVMVGNRGDQAVVVGTDGSTSSLSVALRSRARGITEGGLVFGEASTLDPGTGFMAPTAGFLRCLTTGDTTFIRPSGGLLEIQMVAANDCGEAIVHGPMTPANYFLPEPHLWSSGTLTPLSALATFPSRIGDAPAMNARGQIIVNYLHQSSRAAILTPRCR